MIVGQIADLKSRDFAADKQGRGRSMIMIMGKWSASGGHMVGMVLHLMMGFSWVRLHHTLSGLVQSVHVTGLQTCMGMG
jgi:hypothetical protein